ncbi:MAG: sigma-70 family RNA polymerase sigma factor [Acidobacteria bacterium]|nr:sigma-70 family RNA polymerase sigma factor [Acidobacteriota bacterium]
MNTTRRLDDVIAASLQDATAFHGDLGLTKGAWTHRLATILRRCGKNPDDPAAAAFAERLHNRDLYLATCCAERLDSAWRRFERLYQRHIEELVRCLARNALQALDVSEGLLVDLFLPDRTGQSRIASYDGRSSLATWLHVIITHRVANERVRKWNTVQRPGEMPEVPDRTAVRELEADMRAQRYGRAIDESLRKACDTLSVRERQMLIWRYERGLLLEEIGRLLSIHPSTVCRHLDRVHARLRKDVMTTLAETYGISEAAIAECLNDMCENRAGSVSLLRLIADTMPRGRPGAEPSPQKLHIA